MSELVKSNMALAEWHTEENLQLIKNSMCKDLSDDEFKISMAMALSRGLNPLAKQIYFLKLQGRLASCVSIDGFRSLAAETGLHMGTSDPIFDMESDGVTPVSCKIVVKKLVQGQIVEFSSILYYKEFANSNPNWAKMKRHMLAVRAEGHALKKAFPEKLAGLTEQSEAEDYSKAPSGNAVLDASFEEVDNTPKIKSFEQLEMEGNAKVFDGHDALKSWYHSLKKEEKVLITPVMPSIKSKLAVDPATGELL